VIGPPDPAAWGLPDCTLQALDASSGPTLYRTRGLRRDVLFRRATRSEDQTAWLGRCAPLLRQSSIAGPLPLARPEGPYLHGGWSCEPFLPGRPLRFGEQTGLRSAIRRVHRTAFGLAQRPGFLHARGFLTETRGGDVDLDGMPEALRAQLRAAFAEIPRRPLTLVHGSLGPRDVAVTPWGQYILYRWDHARLDHPLFDLVGVGALDNPVPVRAALAFDIARCWHRDPDCAMSLAARL
jgi:hypothetical protein